MDLVACASDVLVTVLPTTLTGLGHTYALLLDNDGMHPSGCGCGALRGGRGGLLPLCAGRQASDGVGELLPGLLAAPCAAPGPARLRCSHIACMETVAVLSGLLMLFPNSCAALPWSKLRAACPTDVRKAAWCDSCCSGEPLGAVGLPSWMMEGSAPWLCAVEVRVPVDTVVVVPVARETSGEVSPARAGGSEGSRIVEEGVVDTVGWVPGKVGQRYSSSVVSSPLLGAGGSTMRWSCSWGEAPAVVRTPRSGRRCSGSRI